MSRCSVHILPIQYRAAMPYLIMVEAAMLLHVGTEVCCARLVYDAAIWHRYGRMRRCISHADILWRRSPQPWYVFAFHKVLWLVLHHTVPDVKGLAAVVIQWRRQGIRKTCIIVGAIRPAVKQAVVP